MSTPETIECSAQDERNRIAARPLIVVISWPGDPDRGVEPYGPFADEAERDQWVTDCQDAASLGYTLLAGAHYLLSRLEEPPDPTGFITDGYTETH